ncbi:Do family serine endopeptidase [Frigidibacter sp. MR17.24]|uniref:Do family serine endopeptidase n=1 Tax=Frigidibacter sp. MR17.24 TaxID=3127345 RepID=UPI003012E968
MSIRTITRSKASRSALAGLAITAAVGASGAAMMTASPALAVPAGGYADLVEKLAPSVVYIEVTEKQPEMSDQQKEQMQMMQELQRRFGMPGIPPGAMEGNSKPVMGVGSGFIINKDGTIVTNNHVVDGAETVKVKLSDGRSFDAKVIGTDPMTDVAVIKISADVDLPAVNFGNSDTMRVGDAVLAVGSPFGLGGTVTSGIISAKSRDIQAGPYDDYIQTDAAINRGNSGGPLFNEQGQVIGVNTAIFSPDGGSVGIGFAVPSDLVQNVVGQLENGGEISRGWLGVQIRPMSDEVAQVLGYDNEKGAVVAAVVPGSPADKAGLQNGDILLNIGKTKIDTVHDLTRAVADTKPGTTEKLTVLRHGENRDLDVTIGDLSHSKDA